MSRCLDTNLIAQFQVFLLQEERSSGTIEKYIRDVTSFVNWLNERSVTKELIKEWKEHLLVYHYAPVTINSMLAALNSFFRFVGWNDLHTKFLKIQRRLFRNQEKELTRAEYDRLVETAQSLGRLRLRLLIETICATGIRVSEVKYITVEALSCGRADISLKGKVRTILIPGKLCRKLLKYAKKQKIASGEIFLTKSGRSLSRRQIWTEMKRLCEHAGVASSKVFPHNLRHVFAVSFYKIHKDIVQLADVLGHSSIDTTRIYLLSTGSEHKKNMERLGLVT